MKLLCGVSCVVVAAVFVGCGSSNQTSLVSSVGNYSSAPMLANRAKLGITPFKIEDDQASQSPQALSNVAADEMGRLFMRSGRFEVIDRNATNEILEHNKLTGIARPGRFVQNATVPGVDYLLIGTLSNIHITREAQPPEDGVVNKVKSFANKITKNEQAMVSAACTVAIQIVDPATGDVVVFNNTELHESGSAESMGIDVMQTTGGATTQPRISDADRAAVARLALDDSLRKSLPKIDRFLQSRVTPVAKTPTPAAPSTMPSQSPVQTQSQTQTNAPASANKVCATCGAENDKAAKFCKRCGAKL